MNKGKKSKLAVIFIAALAIYLAWTLIDQQRVIYSMNNEKKVLEAKIEDEKKQNEQLKKEKEMVNTDEYLEKMAREKLGMVKQNERIFIDAGQ